MVDIALIVVACIMPFILMVVNLVIMAKYLDPSATSGHYLGKLMILVGLLLAECTVLLLPLDVVSPLARIFFWHPRRALASRADWPLILVLSFPSSLAG